MTPQDQEPAPRPARCRIVDLDDPRRLAAARRLQPATPGNEVLDRLSGLAARLLRTGSAQVSLLTDVQVVAGGAGAGAQAVVGPPSRREDSLCTATARSGAPLVVADASHDSRVVDLPPVRAGAVGSYLGVPLADAQGLVVGAFCVYDQEPRSLVRRRGHGAGGARARDDRRARAGRDRGRARPDADPARPGHRVRRHRQLGVGPRRPHDVREQPAAGDVRLRRRPGARGPSGVRVHRPGAPRGPARASPGRSPPRWRPAASTPTSTACCVRTAPSAGSPPGAARCTTRRGPPYSWSARSTTPPTAGSRRTACRAKRP